MAELAGKTVIITGASGGIGAAITERCLLDGASVIGCDRDLSALIELWKQTHSERLHAFQLDVTAYNEVEALFEQITSNFPGADCLVNNVGIYLGQSILQYTSEQIDEVVAVNIKSAIYFSQLFGRHILDKSTSGAIVNISSVAGQEGSSDAVYGLSKAALIGLTKSCAMSFAPSVRANAIAPGLVETDMIKSVPEWRVKEYRENELMKEHILPQDVANTVNFLLSGDSRNYTGAVFDINNGCYIR